MAMRFPRTWKSPPKPTSSKCANVPVTHQSDLADEIFRGAFAYSSTTTHAGGCRGGSGDAAAGAPAGALVSVRRVGTNDAPDGGGGVFPPRTWGGGGDGPWRAP